MRSRRKSQSVVGSLRVESTSGFVSPLSSLQSPVSSLQSSIYNLRSVLLWFQSQFLVCMCSELHIIYIIYCNLFSKSLRVVPWCQSVKKKYIVTVKKPKTLLLQSSAIYFWALLELPDWQASKVHHLHTKFTNLKQGQHANGKGKWSKRCTNNHYWSWITDHWSLIIGIG